MMRRNALKCVAMASAIAFSLLPVQHAAAAPRVHTVVIDKMRFGGVPPDLRVGDTIVWVNNDLFRHTATARDNSFSLDLAPKSSGKTVIKRSGSIPFHCLYHPGMKGALTVIR